jgi:type I restriction enzyme S subunit
MIPSNWTLVEANDLCHSIFVGIVIKPSQYYVDDPQGVKAFRSANVREGFINDKDWVYFSSEGHLSNKKSELITGDVLIVRTGYPGTACVVTPEFAGSNAIDIVIARPDQSKTLPEYLCSYTNSSLGKSQVLNLQGGMAQKHLNVGAYQGLNVLLPPLPEQRKIAEILSTWDKAIVTTEKLIAASQQQKKALMQQLLTGKKRFAGFSDDWEEVKLEQAAGRIYGGGTPSRANAKYWNGDIPWVTVKDLKSTTITGAQEHITKQALDESSANLVPANTVIISTRMALGKAVVATKNVAINQDLKAISSSNKVITTFLHYWFLYQAKNIKSMGTGSTVKGVQITSIKLMLIKLPSLPEQQKIAAVLTSADQEIDALQSKLAHLKQEKKALMQQLLTGKRRVVLEAETSL